MSLPYNVILCEEGTEKLLTRNTENALDLGEPKKGGEYPVLIDGKLVYYKVVELGEPKLDYDEEGKPILCQDLRVKRP